MIPFSAHFALDYRDAARDPKLLHNLSAVAVAGRFLWTASDEGRSLECLEPDGDGYRLRRQYRLDSLFPDLPGKKSDDEADVEALAVDGDSLWICGSHCWVRKKTESPSLLSDEIVERPSRHLLGRVKLVDDGGRIADFGEVLSFTGRGSLREALAKNKFLGPFLELPSKENGLDIEGTAVGPDGRLLFGLRGPLFDSFAVVVSAEIDARIEGACKSRSGQSSSTFSILAGWACATSPVPATRCSCWRARSPRRRRPSASIAGSRKTRLTCRGQCCCTNGPIAGAPLRRRKIRKIPRASPFSIVAGRAFSCCSTARGSHASKARAISPIGARSPGTTSPARGCGDNKKPAAGGPRRAPAKAPRITLNKSATAISHASARCRSHG
jgi:Protein of unknown function (DUF3616)